MSNQTRKENRRPIPSGRRDFLESFLDWERRVRGTQIFDYEVELEPVFSRLTPSERSSQVVDDARTPGRFSRLLPTRRIANRPRTEASHPTLPNQVQPSELASIRVDLPNELDVPQEQTEQILHNLANCAQVLSYEVIVTRNEISIQITCPTNEEVEVLAQLNCLVPQIHFRSGDDLLTNHIQPKSNEIGIIVDFGLAKEWFIPLPSASHRSETLLPLLGALDNLEHGEVAVLQVLFGRTSQDWQGFVKGVISDQRGKLRIPHYLSYESAIKEKLSNPLLTCRIRLLIQGNSLGRSVSIAKGTRAYFRQFSAPDRNTLYPLPESESNNSKQILSFLKRTSYRTGMLFAPGELARIAHLPTDDIRSSKLKRNDTLTRPAPDIVRGGNILLGENHHRGRVSSVRLSEIQANQHLYILGGSGVGKSTFICNLALEAIKGGNGVAVLDPHGDLVSHIAARIPKERLDDVIHFSPADEDFPVPMNFISANNELEKSLLASDLVSIFKRYSSSFGDVMESTLSSALIAFLESSRGGSLLDLKRFLSDPKFRIEFLESVEDEETRYYWEEEYPKLRNNALSPILTRLNLFLRSKIIRNIVGQESNSLDFRRIMDEKKILLMPLSQGLIGIENSAILGTLILSKIYLAALSRQNVPENERASFFVIADEAHNFLTPSLNQILSSSRKYGVGILGFAHQELTQIKNDSIDILNSVLSNCYTRVLFRLAETDAAKLAKGLSFFSAEHLTRLGVGEAIVRVEQSKYSFNLKTFPLSEVSSQEGKQKIDYIIENTRKHYAVPKADVEKQLESKRAGMRESGSRSIRPNSVSDPHRASKNKTKNKKEELENKQRLVPKPKKGRGGKHHQDIQRVVGRIAESNGFVASVEEAVPGGTGRVDVSLTNGETIIACEISVTTTDNQEIENVKKCLRANYDYVCVVVAERDRIPKLESKIESSLEPSSLDRIKVLSLTGLIEFLRTVNAPSRKASDRKPSKGHRINIEEASKMLNVSVSTLYRWAKEGKVPYYRPGREYQFDPEELRLFGREDQPLKRAKVDLPPIELGKKTSKSKRSQNKKYRDLLKLDRKKPHDS